MTVQAAWVRGFYSEHCLKMITLIAGLKTGSGLTMTISEYIYTFGSLRFHGFIKQHNLRPHLAISQSKPLE